MPPIEIFRHNIHFHPESERVIIRPFIPDHKPSIAAMIDRILAMSEEQVLLDLAAIRQEFDYRHFNIDAIFDEHYQKLSAYLSTQPPLSKPRQQLIGALFSGEYALESAAIFNPSIVPHPDQSQVPEGSLRFIMSLRATGEGHISSIEFRTGLIDAEGTITLDPISRFVSTPQKTTALTPSNYELVFSETLAMSERIIFPSSPAESHGIEDARFVKFTDSDGSLLYYATYTAYNGHVVIPQFIETTDFLHFKILTLHGNAVQNKGMALFPRRINGQYAMLSRHDGENLFIMFSEDPHTWNNPTLLLRPVQLWECVKIGNCGSPLETPAGWLVLTHGVGPMRKYCIGAVLLDLDDPTRVLGRLKNPLLMPLANEREGYVPNVVYSCGSMIHGKNLILPYAMNDTVTTIASISLEALIVAILKES